MSDSALERELRAAAELAEAAARVGQDHDESGELDGYGELLADELPSAEQLREALDLDEPGAT